MNIQKYNKAIVAGVVGVIALIATHFGLDFNPELEAAATVVITTFFVYLIPNRE